MPRRRPPADPVLYLVVCAAPPARRIGELVTLLRGGGWRVCVVPTPTAAGGWVDLDRLAAQTGYPVRYLPRGPEEPSALPIADALAVVPATFNTINTWAVGVSDTLALGVLNEALGLRLPIVVSPYAKPSLAAHPAFGRSLELLRAHGARLTATEAIRPAGGSDRFGWSVVVEALRDQWAGRR
jgi:phosphopantothenoylcysteine synthetase/decarboxylase